MTNGNSLTIQETLIANLSNTGIDVNAAPGTRVKIMDSAAFHSMGNNTVIDNTTNTFGTIAPLAGT